MPWRKAFYYQKADVLYHITYVFCKRFLPAYGDRTVDQMVQAARSGKQNIVEGIEAGMTSTETQIKLLNVARASLQELREDYHDFLTSRNLSVWHSTHTRYAKMLDFCRNHNRTEDYQPYLDTWSAEEMANTALTLCHLTDTLLNGALKKMEEQERLLELNRKLVAEKEYALLEQIQTDCLIDLKDHEMESFQGKLWIVKKQAPVKVVLSQIEYGAYPGFTLSPVGKTIEGVSVSPADFPLTIRTVQKGDRIALRYGTKKLSRFFIDRKIPIVIRKNWLVMENASGRIIFVPQIGCDVQHFSAQPNLFMLQ